MIRRTTRRGGGAQRLGWVAAAALCLGLLAPAAASASGLSLGLPQQGSDDAPVTIVGFTDYQCPFCGRVLPALEQVRDRYGPAVRIVWANLPLPFHKDAEPAARAALAADRQGAFEAMHERLFANQRALTAANFERWATELDLNVERFRKDMADPALGQRIAHHKAMAAAVGARGTPNFFVNGKQVIGAQPFDRFAGAVDEALRDYGKHSDAGLKGRALLDATWKDGDATAGPLLLAMLLDGKAPPPPPPAPAEARRKAEANKVWHVPLRIDDHVRGPADAPVTIVVYTDLECPFCARGERTLRALRERYGDKLRVVARHHPLPFHKHARAAHRATLAADQQGKFWPFYDQLWDHQRELTEDRFGAIARTLGLDEERFAAASARVDQLDVRIDFDIQEARALGVRGTPNFFVNGRSVRGAQPEATFVALIDAELERHIAERKAYQRWHRKELKRRKKQAARAERVAKRSKAGTRGISGVVRTPTWYQYVLRDTAPAED